MTRPTLDDLKKEALIWGPRPKGSGRWRPIDGRKYHQLMLKTYGERKNARCELCVHLKHKGNGSRTRYGCEISPLGLSHSEASDWRKKYDACGKFEGRKP